MVKVYVSSTFKDLQAERAAVRLAVERMRLPGVAMEAYVAESERPLDRCLRDVRDCDVYVGVFAWRYGYIPPGQNTSITELEYRQAVEAGKPTLIFLLDQDAPWPRSRMDQDLLRIETLREELTTALLCSTFHTADELAGLVGAALHNHLTELRHNSAGRAPAGAPGAGAPPAAEQRTSQVRAEGDRSVAIGGGNSGIVSTGDGARNVQMRAQASDQGRVYQSAGDQHIFEGDDQRRAYGGDHVEFHHNTSPGTVAGKQVNHPEPASPDGEDDAAR
ncbi:hypothetical protein HD597_003580 [Nonomuraea thailandensis]|uniref:DUF4062 domain-containing protein n=1 Tax=Nonomuraea thailandensis TaxID=1188745 RepID=A0A9X2K208_9ACTN|nr:DUF4062 domain-containing protein [Nonomuraea thailandensis]MCP2356560.1 hypothetical protein [Nonomuraea thailandensis]